MKNELEVTRGTFIRRGWDLLHWRRRFNNEVEPIISNVDDDDDDNAKYDVFGFKM